MTLPWIFGGCEMIEKAKKIAFNDEIKENILYLEKLFLRDMLMELDQQY